jgi:hypothetical protein
VDPPSDPCMVLLLRQTSRTACRGAPLMVHGSIHRVGCSAGLPRGRARRKVKSKIVATMTMKSKTANKLWTPEEDERLKSLIENSISLNLVAAKLQRSVSAVKNRARVLKISVKRTGLKAKQK